MSVSWARGPSFTRESRPIAIKLFLFALRGFLAFTRESNWLCLKLSSKSLNTAHSRALWPVHAWRLLSRVKLTPLIDNKYLHLLLCVIFIF